MHLTFTNGTAHQQQWVHDAVNRCLYPLDTLDIDVQVHFTSLTNCSTPHTYMCTSDQDAVHHKSFLIQVEPWADDVGAKENQGLPDPAAQLHEFFMESFAHELGHCVHYHFLTTTALQALAANCFTHIPDGRRGTVSDYMGGERTEHAWANNLREGIAEWFKLSWMPRPLVYDNRTNWHVSGSYLKKFKTTEQVVFVNNVNEIALNDWMYLWFLLSPAGWSFDTSVPLTAQVQRLESGSVDVTEPVVRTIELQSVAKTYPDYFDFNNVALFPNFSWDFIVQAARPVSSASQHFIPGHWGLEEPLLLAFGGGGGCAGGGDTPCDDPNLDMTVFDMLKDGGPGGPLGLDFLHDTHPWMASHFGLPPLSSDRDARSGWLATRAAKFTWDIEGGLHEWGVVEVAITGRYLGNPRIENFPSGTSTLPSDSVGAPWGDNAVGGQGPFSGGLPPTMHNGWQAGGTIYEDNEYTSNHGIIGHIIVYRGVIRKLVILPSESVVPPPAAPVDLPTLAEWSFGPIVPVSMGFQYIVAPGVKSGEYVICWSGPSAAADEISEFEISARFFPITDKGLFPNILPGAMLPGLMQQGSVRAEGSRALAARQLHVSKRVAGHRQSMESVLRTMFHG